MLSYALNVTQAVPYPTVGRCRGDVTSPKRGTEAFSGDGDPAGGGAARGEGSSYRSRLWAS